MSKTSDLRRKATEAVRAKEYDRAVELYEKVCAQDSGNGTPRNELGDVFLKLGDVERAIASFTEAARLYHDFGLTNNAVAVHKKILRHEPNHLHSLWVLGDIRREQGLEAEASAAFLEFLGRYQSVTESEREAFVARGLELIELMGDDPQILSTLESIFSEWDFGQERARVLIAKARLAHEAGEHDVRDKYVEHARGAFEHLDALPDYVDFLKTVDPASAPVEPVSADDDGEDGSGTIVIDDGETSFDFSDDDAPSFEVPTSESYDGSGSRSSRVTLDTSDIDLGFDFDMDALDDVASGPASPDRDVSGAADPVPEVELDDSDASGVHQAAEEPVVGEPAAEEPADEPPAAPEPGVVLGGESAPSEAIAGAPADDDEPAREDEAAETIAESVEATAETEPAPEPAPDPVVESTSDPDPEPDPEPAESVDLLEQILSDEAFDMAASEKRQVDTIAHEMQGQIGNDVDPEDHAGQYEVGMVYMDMALYEQAIGAFDHASEGDDERLRALEMKGTCLLRLERVDDALAVFQEGLAVPGYPGRSYMGLLYGVGAGHEARGDLGEALDYFERVHAVDPAFLDVDARLTRLRAAVADGS